MVKTCHNILLPKTSYPPTTKDTQQLCSYDTVLFLILSTLLNKMKKICSFSFVWGGLFIHFFNLEI